MAKRLGDFNQGFPKKPKTDLDQLWGDDLDDCFEQLASQMNEQEISSQRNVSVVPSYNAFKQQTKRTFTSTQSNPELGTSMNKPSTSGHNNFNTTNHNNTLLTDTNGYKRSYCFEKNDRSSELETKLRKIQDQYYVKEGEVSILRSQLKEIKLQNDKEHMKAVKEWSEKCDGITKQLTAVKSDLEFKNFEIAKLKQQVTDKVKRINHDTTLATLTQSSYFKQPKEVERVATQSLNTSIGLTETSSCIPGKKNDTCADFTISSPVRVYYPLQYSIDSSFFHRPTEEKYAGNIKNRKLYQNSMPILHNQLSQKEMDRLIQLHPKRTLLPNGKELNMDYIQPDVFHLTKCTTQEIEMKENYVYINKIVCTSEQLCEDLYRFMLELEKDFVTDDSEQVDILHLKNNFCTISSNNSLFSPEDWTDGEMGKSARQSITCIAHLLYNSNYLHQYLLENKRLIFKRSEDILESLPVAKTKFKSTYINNYDYLNIILSIVNISGKLKKSCNMSGFLSAVCLLLSKIYLCDNIVEDIHPLITRLVGEIVYVCPNVEALCYLSEFFKSAVLHNEFVKGLCKKSTKGGLKINEIEKIVYFKQDVCVLQVFCVLVGCNSLNGRCDKVLDLYLTVMVFIKNCFKAKVKWMHYQKDKHCGCLTKIVKLGVDMLYQVVEEYKTHCLEIADSKKDKYRLDELSRYADFLRNGIELLQILKYKADDIIVKYVIVYSQYEVTIKALLSLKGVLNLTEAQVESLQNLIDIEATPITEMDTKNEWLWNDDY